MTRVSLKSFVQLHAVQDQPLLPEARLHIILVLKKTVMFNMAEVFQIPRLVYTPVFFEVNVKCKV